MPVVLWPPKVKQREAFEASLRDLVALHRIKEALTVDPHPLPVYNFGLRDVLAKDELGARGRLVSWRYYATDKARGIAVTGDVDTTLTPRVTAVSFGPTVLEAMKAPEKIQGQDQKDPYEPRLLRIPGLLVEAYWVKPLGQPGNDNGWVYAYNTRLKALPAGKYSAEEFFEKVAAGAKAALALNDSPGQDLRKKVADAQVANPQVAGAQREPNAGEQK